MRTEVLKLDGSAQDADRIRHAARLLQAGALVAFPTETVYGLGADARSAEALARLAEVKGRPEGKPFSLLVPTLRQAEEAAGGFSRIARKLTRVYWPGPLTVVVPRRGGGGTAGLRLPEHPVTRALLAQCGFALAAPSANRSGAREPLTAEQVLEDLEGKIPLLLDAGPVWQGRPSVVVRVPERGPPAVQREGLIPKAEILELARPTVLFLCTGNTCRSPMAAALCQRLAKEQGRGESGLEYRVFSAGTSAEEGLPADPLAQEVLREVQVDLSGHRTRPVQPALLDGADWILAMTRAHRESILRVMPECRDRIRLFSARGEDMPDPAAQSIQHYRQVRDRLAQGMKEVWRTIREDERGPAA